MSLGKYFEQRKIEKVVDPEEGNLSPESIPPIDYSALDTSQDTPLPVLLEDISALADNAMQNADKAIEEISHVSDDQVFTAYLEMVKANYFDAFKLADPNYTPVVVYSPKLILAIESEVYARIPDPRAPLVSDLYDLKSELGLTKLNLDTIWREVLADNNLYSDFETSNPVVRYSLFKERQYIGILDSQISSIQKNVLQKVSDSFVNRFTGDLYRSLSYNYDSGVQVNKALLQMRTLLQSSLLLNTDNFKTLKVSLSNVFNNYLSKAYSKLFSTYNNAIVGGFSSKTMRDLELFESILNSSGDVDINKDYTEFSSQLLRSIVSALQTSEADLVYKEGYFKKIGEDRQLQLLNTKKNAMTKQYIYMIDYLLQSSGGTLENQLKEETLQLLSNGLKIFLNQKLAKPSPPKADFVKKVLTIKDNINTGNA